MVDYIKSNPDRYMTFKTYKTKDIDLLSEYKQIKAKHRNDTHSLREK